jgi:hypothetical protein
MSLISAGSISLDSAFKDQNFIEFKVIKFRFLVVKPYFLRPSKGRSCSWRSIQLLKEIIELLQS